MSEGSNDYGSSRFNLVKASCKDSLTCHATHTDNYYMQLAFDANTPVEETLKTLTAWQTDKILYIGCSNLSGWHLVKSLAAQERQRMVKTILSRLGLLFIAPS